MLQFLKGGLARRSAEAQFCCRLSERSLILKCWVVLVSFFLCWGCTPMSKPTYKKLPLERLTASPNLAGDLPQSVKISPDGSRLTFLKAKATDFRVLDLWQRDMNTGSETLLVDSESLLDGGKEKISDQEKARRERLRISSTGIIEYHWSEQGDSILFPISGDLYLYRLGKDQPVQRLTNTDSAEADPRFSPKGNFVSFQRDHNVFVVDLKTGEEKQVTFGGTEDRPMGVAEFIAQEEMARYRGYWWSPDEAYLAVAWVDERPVEIKERFEIYADAVKVVKQRYPSAGTKNAEVQLLVYDVSDAGQKQKPAVVPDIPENSYMPQVAWYSLEKEPYLAYSVQNRSQTNLELKSYSPQSKKSRSLVTETDPAWVNIRHDFLFLKKSPYLLWVTEVSGHSHLLKVNLANGTREVLTSGDWGIRNLFAAQEDEGEVYFSATKESPLENHLYSLKFADPKTAKISLKKITKASGFHSISMSKDPKFYLDAFTDSSLPPSLIAYDLAGTKKFVVADNQVKQGHPLAEFKDGFSDWEYGSLKRTNGPELFYKVLKPKSLDASKKYPVIQFVYGGPHVQNVTKGGGRSDFFHQILAQAGFVVVVADNRGTPNRGRDFERAIFKKFGDLEVRDQAQVMKHVLKENPFLDATRVGVFGHSYGGYLTLMLMMKFPDVYSVGVSGAPVVDWALYDTHYTERYMGEPKKEVEAYKVGNVLNAIEGLKGRLLVVHGMADDNVLYSHSLQLYSALQEAGKTFDIMAYPGAKHGIRQKKSWQHHYLKTKLQYFKDHLGHPGVGAAE